MRPSSGTVVRSIRGPGRQSEGDLLDQSFEQAGRKA